jgi:hypothetical protein
MAQAAESKTQKPENGVTVPVFLRRAHAQSGFRQADKANAMRSEFGDSAVAN